MILQTEISQLAQRQKLLESEIAEALRHMSVGDPMIAYMKSRALYLRDEIERLREEEFGRLH